MIQPLPYCGAPPVPGELFHRFNGDPLLIAALALIALAHLRRVRPDGARFVLAAAGWGTACIALTSPLCALSVALFSARVGQHMLLLLVAAPLVALALPAGLTRPQSPWPPTIAFFTALWFWHMPLAYDATFASAAIYWAMHLTLFSAAVWLWRALLHHPREGALAALAAGTLTSIQMGLLGAIFTLSSHALFAPHFLTAGAWGLTPLSDQQLGGVLMWVPGSALFLLVALRSAQMLWRVIEPAPDGMTPLGYLASDGRSASIILPLTWFTMIVSVAVCVITAGLLWIAIARAAGRGGAAETRAIALSNDRSGDRWITIGLALAIIPLLATLIWTMTALAGVLSPADRARIEIDVTGHRWWWEARYRDATGADGFVTANEIHIPVGVRVAIRLHGADVIHSFWVPKLAGKTDAIPGQRNVTWLQADRPGRYRGQCSEFCGAQHAKMGFEILAEPRDAFERWRAVQRMAAPPPVTETQKQGLALLNTRCGECHTVRGTIAAGQRAPDLTHVMSRRTLAGALLPNNIGSLAGWVQDPQAIKPGSLMPAQKLTGPQLGAVTAYLETLQ